MSTKFVRYRTADEIERERQRLHRIVTAKILLLIVLAEVAVVAWLREGWK